MVNVKIPKFDKFSAIYMLDIVFCNLEVFNSGAFYLLLK